MSNADKLMMTDAVGAKVTFDSSIRSSNLTNLNYLMDATSTCVIAISDVKVTDLWLSLFNPIISIFVEFKWKTIHENLARSFARD